MAARVILEQSSWLNLQTPMENVLSYLQPLAKALLQNTLMIELHIGSKNSLP